MGEINRGPMVNFFRKINRFSFNFNFREGKIDFPWYGEDNPYVVGTNNF